MSAKGNEPAFPESGGQFGFMHGLTKREYFAAAALIQNTELAPGYTIPREIAKFAVACADALLAELEKEVKP